MRCDVDGMDKAYIKSHDVIDRYVMQQLEGNELELFELYMLEHPSTVDEVEYARGLYEALRRNEADLKLETSSAVEASAHPGWLFGRHYAVAATVLLAVVLVLSVSLYQRAAHLEAQLGQRRLPLAIAGNLWLETERGASDSNIVSHAPGSAILIHVVPNTPAPGKVVVNIAGQGNDYQWQSTVEMLDPDAPVEVVLTDIPQGTYRLTLKTPGEGAPLAEYRFEVIGTRD